MSKQMRDSHLQPLMNLPVGGQEFLCLKMDITN